MSRRLVLAAGILLAAATNLGAEVIQIPTVPVGNPGNAADTTGFGSVAERYRIGTYEVTAGQYATFLNAVAATDTYGLYNSNMWSNTYGCKIQRSGSSGSYTYSVTSEWANRPVNWVSFWDAARFVNWLENGQPTGAQSASTTEDGTYTLNGYTGSDGRTITRNANSVWFIPSENEWYKSAYYKGGGTNAGYWDYPTKVDDPTPPVAESPPGGHEPPGSANYNWAGDATHYRTEVGAYSQSPSPYGTFDQGGNVSEWNETVTTGSIRGVRGGAFGVAAVNLHASTRTGADPTSGEIFNIGFRVGSTPEPGSIVLLLSGAMAGLFWRWRRRPA